MLVLLLGLAAAAAAPMKNEPEIWSLVQRVGTRDAYLMYLNRFQSGPHFEDARLAYLKTIGISIGPHAPPAPPVPPPPPVQPPPGSSTSLLADPCIKLLVDENLEIAPTDEAKSVLRAEVSNRVEDYRAYLATYPGGACREMAIKRIKVRNDRQILFHPIEGLGPLAAQRTRELELSEDDYPAAALRAEEQGRVVTDWEVAEDGTPELCRIVQSSGSERLDSGTCRLVTSRLRYDPARDDRGVPIRSRDHASIIWALPQEEPPQPKG